MDEMHSPNAIKFRRVLSGFKQFELAARLGIADCSLSKVENGRRQLTPREAKLLAKIFDCRVEDLFDVTTIKC